MRFILLTLRKDLLRYWREPAGLAAWIGIPIMLTVLLWAFFGRGEARPHGTVLVADQDNTFLSRMVPSAFSQGELGEMFSVRKVDEATGRREMDKGGASALIVIRKGFGDAIFGNKQCEVVVVKNPAQRFTPQMVEDVLQVVRDGAFYLKTLTGISGETKSEDEAVALSMRMARVGYRARRWLGAGVVDVRVETTKTTDAKPVGFANLMLPGMLLMSLLFAANGLSGDWWKEKQDATLRRVLASPRGALEVTLGKLGAYAVIAGVVACLGLGLGHALMGLEMKQGVAAALWALLAGCVAYLLLLLLQTLVSNPRGGEMLASLVVMPGCMIGGCFMPLSEMPASVARIGARTPVGVAMTTLVDTLNGGTPWTAMAVGLLLAAGLTVLAAWLVRARFVF